MALGKAGYLYSIMTMMFLVLLFSLIVFYSSTSETDMRTTVNKITTDKLHFFVNGVREDLYRASYISCKRSIHYSVAHILSTGENFSDYEMINCTGFNYPLNGTQAALAEMVLCGTFEGNKMDFMLNNTLLEWIDKISNAATNADIVFDRLEVADIDIAMYDSMHVGAIVYLNMEVRDSKNTSFFRGYNIPTKTVLIGLNDTVDPLYFIYGSRNVYSPSDVDNVRDLVKYLTVCRVKNFEGPVLDEILNVSLSEDHRCYFTSNVSAYHPTTPGYVDGPCFFDRCEGRLNLSPTYAKQSRELFEAEFVGLESFVNLRNLWDHGMVVLYEDNRSWVDYVYFSRETNTGTCCVYNTCMDSYGWTLRLDEPHIEKYAIRQYNCTDLTDCPHPSCGF